MPTPRKKRAAPDTGIGHRGVTAIWVVVVSVVFVLESLLLLYATMVFWPPSAPPPTAETPVPVPPATSNPVFFGLTIAMTRDQNLLLLVAMLGALGALGHVLRSFFKYVGERNLLWSWVPSYFLIPFVGAILATISYILLRAGLIGGSTGAAGEGNTWGFAAIATLVGLFSAQAAAKLKDIFEVVLAPSKQGADSIAPVEGPPGSFDFGPKDGPEGTVVGLTGDGLSEVTAVIFGGGVVSPATWDATLKVLTTEVPPGATTGPLTVTAESGEVTSTEDFTVT